MASIKKDTTIKEYQNFIQRIYGLPNDRQFNFWDMLSNVERFAMRGLKGIRKEDKNKAKINFLVSLSWFASLMNQLHIDIESEIWKRFPYLCSYCGSCPCLCKEKKIKERQKIISDETKCPKTLNEFQIMFNEIYPAEKRTTEHAGIHLAEEIGELSETMLSYNGSHKQTDFQKIPFEAADVLSCLMGVFNSLGINISEELALMFSNNCYVCHKSPCECSFTFITTFES